jgi:hypothetical protein
MMTNEQLDPMVSLADIRLLLVITIFGAITTLLLPVYYLHLILSGCDASGAVRKRFAHAAVDPIVNNGDAFGIARADNVT